MKHSKLKVLTAATLGLFIATQSSASTLLVTGHDLTKDEQIDMDRVIRKYTGPDATHFKQKPDEVSNPKFASLFAEVPNAERDFIQGKIDRKLGGDRAKTYAIPTTLFDVYVTMRYMQEPTIRKIFESNEEDDCTQRFFDVSQGIAADITTSPETDQQELFKGLLIQYLETISSLDAEIMPQHREELSKDLRKIKAGKNSILATMMNEEYAAAQKNEVVLVRSTWGCNFMLTSLSDKECALRGMIEDVKRQHGCRFSTLGIKHLLPTIEDVKDTDIEVHRDLIAGNKEDEQKNGYYSEAPQPLLDFTLGTTSNKPVAKAIETYRALAQGKKDDLRGKSNSMDLSYASSLLGGLLFDSYNRRQGACTYAYHTKGTAFTYSLRLNKKWALQDGANLFHFNGLARDSIFEAGEIFHPRLRAVLPSSGYIDSDLRKTTVLNNSIPTGLVSFKEDMPAFKINDDLTDEKQNDIRTMMQFAMMYGKLLTRARIISMNGDVFSSPNETAEAQALIASHRLALQTMGKSWIGDDWTMSKGDFIEDRTGAESGSASAAAAASSASSRD